MCCCCLSSLFAYPPVEPGRLEFLHLLFLQGAVFVWEFLLQSLTVNPASQLPMSGVETGYIAMLRCM